MTKRFILSVLLIIFCAAGVFLQTKNAADILPASAGENAADGLATDGASADSARTDVAVAGSPQTQGASPVTGGSFAAQPLTGAQQSSGTQPSSGAQPSIGTQPSIAAQPSAAAQPGGIALIGLNDIIFRPDNYDESPLPIENAVMDFEYLMNNIFLAQPETGVLTTDADADKLRAANMKLKSRAGGPKILIFHTHSNEMYADSAPADPMEGIMGVGRYLAALLTDKYGIETLHHTGRYDVLNGAARIPGAYERMEPDIRRVLAENPSIEMVIDLHRDGVNPGVPPMVENVNGKRTARIMFVTGMCRVNSNGVISDAPGLENPYIFENMALSFQAQTKANELFPGFARRVYMKPYRYSLHMMPKSLLTEVGAQNNTKREAMNAAEALAEILSRVVG